LRVNLTSSDGVCFSGVGRGAQHRISPNGRVAALAEEPETIPRRGTSPAGFESEVVGRRRLRVIVNRQTAEEYKWRFCFKISNGRIS